METYSLTNSSNCNTQACNSSSSQITLESLVLTATSTSLISGCVLLWILHFRKKSLKISLDALTLFKCLTIADIFTAGGNLMGLARDYDAFYSTHLVISSEPACQHNVLCVVQSFITTVSSMCSFFWTFVIAIYYYWKIGGKENSEVTDAIFRRYQLIFHVICWGIPITITSFALGFGALGSDSLYTGGWCWIQICSYESSTRQRVLAIGWMTITGKGWEIFVYHATFIIYWLMLRNLKFEKKLQILPEFMRHDRPVNHALGTTMGISVSTQNLVEAPAQLSKEEKLFLIMPIFLYLERIWGTIRYFMSGYLMFENDCYLWCRVEYASTILQYLQGVGDSSQALFNFFLLLYYSEGARNLFCRRSRTRSQIQHTPQAH